MNTIPFTLTDQVITFFYEGKQKTFAADHPSFRDIVSAVLENNTSLIKTLVNVRKLVAKVTEGRVMITTDDDVVFDGKPVPDYLASRILSHYRMDERLVTPLLKFAENLMENPNLEVREDLYSWLEAGKMPITSDGHFIAYKLVRDDFSPIHRGPYGQDQSPGTLVWMPRSECDENRDNTCSRGLHFCSYEYLPVFQGWNRHQGEKVILLKINPRDVVSIPTDYNLSKGRCCEFFVLEEIDPNKIKEEFGDLLVYEEEERVLAENEAEPDWKNIVLKEIASCDGNKTQAAKNLGISRSTLYRIIKD